MNSPEPIEQWLVSSDAFHVLSEYLAQKEVVAPLTLMQQFELLNKNKSKHSFMPSRLLTDFFQFADSTLDDNLIALHCGEISATKNWGFLGYLIQSCQTIGNALELLVKYSELVTNQFRVRLIDEDGSVWLDAKPMSGVYDPRSRYFVEYVISSFLRLMKRWASSDSLCEGIYFPWGAPCTVGRYDEYFGVPCYFEADSLKIKLVSQALQIKLQHRDPRMFELMLEKTSELYQHAVMQEGWLMDLRNIIVNNLSQGPLSLADISLQMNIGERALRRKLQKQGLTYQGLVDDIRKIVAISVVKEARLSLTDISLLLGYAEQSSFQRAFKRWTGRSPLQY